MGSSEWYATVEARGEELGDLLYEKLKDQMGSKPSPASPTPLVSKKSKITGRDRERIVDELEATVDAIRAELELLGPRLRSSRSAARLFLALDRMSRETREVLFAMVDAENATQH